MHSSSSRALRCLSGTAPGLAPVCSSSRVLRRRLSGRVPESASLWNPANYSEFAQERLRPARDLLHRVPRISANQPDIIDAGCGEGGPSKLLLERFPAAKLLCLDASEEMLAAAQEDDALNGREMVKFSHGSIEEHFAASAATSGKLYDLVFSNAALHWCSEPAPALMGRMLSRLRPGGALAVQMPDNREQPSHILLRETASECGLSDEEVRRVPSNRHAPHEFEDALLGPLCQTLDMWSTTYVQRLHGENPVHRYVRATAMRPVLAALGGEDTEKARHFEETCE